MQFTKLPTKTFVYIRPQFSCWYLHLPKNPHIYTLNTNFHFLNLKFKWWKAFLIKLLIATLVVGVHLHVNFLLISASSNFVKALKIVNKAYEQSFLVDLYEIEFITIEIEERKGRSLFVQFWHIFKSGEDSSRALLQIFWGEYLNIFCQKVTSHA